MKTGFWKALIGSCSGTAVFAALRQQHLGRAFWHLFLMLLLCSLLMTWGWNAKFRPMVSRGIDVFVENCGGVRVDESGMKPLENPDKMRTFLLPGAWSVTYLPPPVEAAEPVTDEAAEAPTDEDFTMGAKQGIVWTPRQCMLWNKVADGYEGTVLSHDPGKMRHAMRFGSVAELFAGVRQAPDGVFSVNGEEPLLLPPALLKKEVKIAFAIGIFIMTFWQIACEVLLYVFMFAGVFSLMNLGKRRSVSFKELLKLEIYAGFPAMLIGSAAAALDLPILEFNLIYVPGMTIYLIWILNHFNVQEENRAAHRTDAP